MAIFQPRPLQIPNMRTDYSAENQAVQGLADWASNAIPNLQKQQLQNQKQQILGQIATGKVGFEDAGKMLIGLGDTQSGVALLGLGQKAQERDLEKAWLGGGVGSSTGSPSSTSSPLGASLINNESGGNWGAQNNAVGAGGNVGHFGRAQFGVARLEEAAKAGAIPPGTTPQQFMQSPELQKRAEAWHVNDIDANIKANGFDRLVGQRIGGVPVTIEGLRAVAHLGGVQGMKRFVETQGGYNPSDRNGTSLMDYFSRHGGGGAPTQVAAAPAQPRVQVAENEADVQRLEQAQSDAANRPAAGATPAQGFAVPGGESEFQQRSILSDRNVQLWQQRLNTAPTERTRAIAQNNLNLAVKDAEQRFAEGKAPEAVREWQWARKNGLTEAKSPIAYAKEKSEATRQDTAPVTRQIKQPDGSEVIVQWNPDTRRWDPLEAPAGGEAVRPKGVKLTEQQSKDLIYYNRGLQALETFDPVAGSYASGIDQLASRVPGGNYVVSEDFQRAKQAGDNFLTSILRKDTGAAITNQEQEIYGRVFLPQPGDKPAVLAQKSDARRQAIDALRSGLGPAEVLALGQRLTTRQPGEGAPAPAAAPNNTPQQRQQTSTPNPTATGPNGQRLMWDGNAWVPFS